jgi:hypothetical protein
MFPHRTLIAAIAVACAMGTGAVALAAGGTQSPTRLSVTPATTLTAGDMPPGDVPGVRAIRRGTPIPAGYVLVGQTVDATRGAKAAGAFLRFACPGTKRLRSFVASGRVGFVADRPYVNHRQTFVGSFPPFGKETEVSGTLWAVCR